MRSKARMILEAAFMPPGSVIPPTTAASRLEAALHQHFGEEDLGSGKRYLRRLRAVWGYLAHDSPSALPQLRELVATGDPLNTPPFRVLTMIALGPFVGCAPMLGNAEEHLTLLSSSPLRGWCGVFPMAPHES